MLKRFGMVASVLALLVLALAGCKNGMLGEDEATVNGLRDAGDNKVALIVTNFEDAGQLRTVAPAEINLKAGDYTYVAEATRGRGKWGPEKVTVDIATARVDLAGLPAGVWVVTLTAYDETLLTLNGVADPGNADVGDITAVAENAAVLSGTATVDVTGGTTEAKITLTPWSIGKNGSLTVNFTFNDEDIAKIVAATANYEITVGIYNRNTGEVIQDVGPATTVKTLTNPTNGNKMQSYQPDNKVAKGDYTLKLSIKNTNTNKTATWSDLLTIEGNREINASVTLPKLLDGAPNTPENFAAYWDSAKVNAEGEGYVMQFAWDRKSFNETEFEIELADITAKYTKSGVNAVQYDGQAVADGEELWEKIDADGAKVVYSFNKDNFADPLKFPIYAKNGSVLAGSSSVEYRLLTGSVYTARIRAKNDFGQSAWVYLGASLTEPASKWTAGTADRLDDTSEFIFDVFTINYDLGQYMLLKQGQAQTDGQKSTVIPVKYDRNTPHAIDYPEYSQQNTGDYQLYPATFVGTADQSNQARVEWTGWKNEFETGNTPYTKARPYDGYKDAKLKPMGGGVVGSSALVDVMSSGTTANLITEQTLLISNVQAAQSTDKLESNQGQNISGVTPGLGKANNIYGINREVTGVAINQTTLYFSIGAEVPVAGAGNQFQMGKVKDAQDRVHTVLKATYQLKKGEDVYVEATGAPDAQFDITNLSSGAYTLFVTVLFSTGNSATFQTPFIVKCVDETV